MEIGDKRTFLLYVNFSLNAKYDKGFVVSFDSYLPNNNGDTVEEVLLSRGIPNAD